jgi:hypothetical protein
LLGVHYVISIAVLVFAGILLVLLGQDVLDVVRRGSVFQRRRQAPTYFRALLRLSKSVAAAPGAWLLAIGAAVLIAGFAIGYLSRGGANPPRTVAELNGTHREVVPFDSAAQLNSGNRGHVADGEERNHGRP